MFKSWGAWASNQHPQHFDRGAVRRNESEFSSETGEPRRRVSGASDDTVPPPVLSVIPSASNASSQTLVPAGTGELGEIAEAANPPTRFWVKLLASVGDALAPEPPRAAPPSKPRLERTRAATLDENPSEAPSTASSQTLATVRGIQPSSDDDALESPSASSDGDALHLELVSLEQLLNDAGLNQTPRVFSATASRLGPSSATSTSRRRASVWDFSASAVSSLSPSPAPPVILDEAASPGPSSSSVSSLGSSVASVGRPRKAQSLHMRSKSTPHGERPSSLVIATVEADATPAQHWPQRLLSHVFGSESQGAAGTWETHSASTRLGQPPWSTSSPQAPPMQRSSSQTAANSLPRTGQISHGKRSRHPRDRFQQHARSISMTHHTAFHQGSSDPEENWHAHLPLYSAQIVSCRLYQGSRPVRHSRAFEQTVAPVASVAVPPLSQTRTAPLSGLWWFAVGCHVEYEIRVCPFKPQTDALAPESVGSASRKGSWVVRRRYREFRALYDGLDKLAVELCSGQGSPRHHAQLLLLGLPPFPPRTDLGAQLGRGGAGLFQQTRFNRETIQTRRHAFQSLLNFVLSHPVFGRSELMERFLGDA